MSIRNRIFLVFMVMLTLGVSGLTWWIQDGMKPRYMEAQEDPLVDLSQLLAALIATHGLVQDPVDGGSRLDLAFLDRAFEVLEGHAFAAQIYALRKERVDIRVYVTDAEGRVLFDSDQGRDLGQDYAEWRDVHYSLRGEYGARSTEGDPLFPAGSTMYIGSPILLGGEILGVVSVGKPTRNAERFMADALDKLFLAALLAALAATLVGLVLHGWLSRPLQRLTDYARAVRAGERVALPDLGRNEVGRVGAAIAEMRSALDGKSYVEAYVQAMTHELKSPLAAIRGAAELLAEPMPGADRARFLEHIRNQAGRMQALIERLLDLAALENLSELQQRSEIAVGPLLQGVIEGLQPLALRREIDLHLLVKGESTLLGDPFLLHTAVHNLVKNAIECSQQGAEVELSTRRDGGDVLIRVRDQGPGIPDYARARVFERFYTLPRSDGHKGSGLGLSFVREIAALFGGQVSLSSPATGGTLAALRLPLGPIQAGTDNPAS